MSIIAIGSYTHHAQLDARGKGITILDWNDDTDERSIIDVRSEIRNPTYLVWHADLGRLYTVSEVDHKMGAVAAYRSIEGGRLEYIQQAEGRGGSGCHLTVIPSLNRVYAAAYGDGSLSSYELTDTGLGEPVMSRFYEGQGPNEQRQEGPHAHQVTLSPFGAFLYVCDLGCDAVWMHTLADADNSAIPPRKALAVPPGYGPRHLAYDHEMPLAYILCELIPKLLVAEVDPVSGIMTVVQELDTVEKDQAGIAAPAAIKVHPSGQTVAVSNRFDDTIAVFGIHRMASAGKRLSFIDRFSCGGQAPRDIEFNDSGSRLFIGNQDSHAVTCRHFDPLTGVPASTWAEPFETGSPVCIVTMEGLG